ncbi:short-chain dehydrogenase [Trypanosoma grayi]|uniref:short-chain dehydrogenase n=1 Tax=Trypanosoma grayi TaxID=71804 RepID=UPI0004F47DD2|nr:short-chain dehydrogenase [Trypanosoma grayi]KEG10113.1 short-chain dehydrogenase [Trypanosoma grayi]
MVLPTLGKVALSLLAIIVVRAMVRRARCRPLTRGSVALITGGGGGIGLEFARFFARSGCRVVLVGRNAEALREAQASCIALGAPSADIIVADLSTVDGTDKVGAELQQQEHPVKYMVLNAGAGAIVPFSSGPEFHAICENMMQINYFANVRLLQQLLPILEKTHSAENPSRVVVVSSLAGVLPSIYRSAYTASKHAIQGFMNALRGETSVSITLCCPGYVDTDFHRRAQLQGSLATGNHRRGVPPDVCVQQCMTGALCGDAEVLTTLTGKLGYVLRPVFTSLIDTQAKKMSVRSLQK